MQTRIYVENQLFLGRLREQRQYREVLREALGEREQDAPPYVVLLYGDGGIGKTTLGKRLRDIALTEPPFEGQFQHLWIDWEEERKRHVNLQVGRANVQPETVFDVLHQAAIRCDWGRRFRAYQKAGQQRGEAEQAAAQVLAGELSADLAPLRGLSADIIARLVRMQAPVIGQTGEQWVKAAADFGLKVSVEQGAQLYGALQHQLQARMKPDLYRFYLNPRQQLALALAEGLQRVARSKRLLLALDTYEIVDVVDHPWMRQVMRAAGPRLLWILSGRNDLAGSRAYGDGYFHGYEAEFGHRLLAFDLPELALADVQAYFAERIPDRPLGEADARAISRATRGIPLAVKQAAEMWQKGCDLAQIAGAGEDLAPAHEIVAQMTGRYLLHAVQAQDRRGLYALALAGGDRTALAAMLRPAGEAGAAFDLAAELGCLQRLYASVHLEQARLHDEPAAFLLAHLRQPNQRHSPSVQDLRRRAIEALAARLAAAATELPRLEERCQDEDWVADALHVAEHHFALDEQAGWRWLIPHFVAGLAYSAALRNGLLDIAGNWKAQMRGRGRRRLAALRAGVQGFADVEDQATMLAALEQVDSWLAGENEAELRAILAWRRGRQLADSKQYRPALRALERAAQAAPPHAPGLLRQIGEAMYQLAGRLLWPEGATGATRSPDAARLLRRAVQWLPDKQGAWYYLGVSEKHEGRYEKAMAAYGRAIELDPNDAYPHNGLGNVYYDLGRHEEAMAAYRQASALDPQYAYPHYNLGLVYADLGRHEEAMAAYRQASELDPQYAAPHNGLGNVYSDLGRHEEAIAAYRQAIELDPQYAYPHNNLGGVYAALGRHEEAMVAYSQAIELDPNFVLPQMSLAAIYRKLGDEAAYRRQIDLARPLMARQNAYNRACFAAICGDVEEALALLQHAIAQAPGARAAAQRGDFEFDFIRDDPRFQALVQFPGS